MKSKQVYSQYIAEFIGTFFLVFLGCGSVVLSETNSSSMAPFVPMVFGGAVSILIYSIGHISGAHMNPAVTIAFWSVGRFPFNKILGYIFSQIFGAILASFVIFFIWGNTHTFGMTAFSVSPLVGFFVEFLITFLLMFVVMSVATDSRAVGELAGIAIGTTVALCAFVGGPLTGASMNPARTLGPGLVSGEYEMLWAYILAPILGAIIGAFTYNKIRCFDEDVSEDHGCC